MNTVMYIKNLEAVGFTRAQAEAQAEGLADFMETKFATKQDLREMTTEMRFEMKEIRLELRVIEQRMTIKLGSLMAVGMSLLAILHFFK